MTATTLVTAPVSTFTAPDQYIGLPDFWQALDAWLWAAQFGQMQRMWAGMRLHSERVKAANARTLARMEAVDCSRFSTDNSRDDDERWERRRLWREWKG